MLHRFWWQLIWISPNIRWYLILRKYWEFLKISRFQNFQTFEMPNVFPQQHTTKHPPHTFQNFQNCKNFTISNWTVLRPPGSPNHGFQNLQPNNKLWNVCRCHKSAANIYRNNKIIISEFSCSEFSATNSRILILLHVWSQHTKTQQCVHTALYLWSVDCLEGFCREHFCVYIRSAWHVSAPAGL